MRHFKILDENNCITAIGVGEGGIAIGKFEYDRLKEKLASAPSDPEYEYFLSDNGEWIGKKIEPSDEAVREIFAQQILASISVAKKPSATKEGYILKQEYDAETRTINWVYVPDPDYIRLSGTYTNPTEWQTGMMVLAGINEDYISDGWYIYEGFVQRCIKNGSPNSFFDAEYWEIM